MTDRERPKNRKEALQLVAGRVGGTFAEARVTGGYTVSAPHEAWTLTMALRLVNTGLANVMHTGVRATFHKRGDLRLVVRPRMFLDPMVRGLGLGSYVRVDPALERTHVARGHPVQRARAVLASGLAEALIRHGPFKVEVKRAPFRIPKELGPGARVLEVLSPGVDTDVERLVEMFEVTRLGLDALLRAGVASPEAPGPPDGSD